ncbi:MAG: hypothetical protein ACWA5T_12230 [Parvularcula sp.]
MKPTKQIFDSEIEKFQADFAVRPAIEVALEIAPSLVRAEAMCRMQGLSDISGPLALALDAIESYLVAGPAEEAPHTD